MHYRSAFEKPLIPWVGIRGEHIYKCILHGEPVGTVRMGSESAIIAVCVIFPALPSGSPRVVHDAKSDGDAFLNSESDRLTTYKLFVSSPITLKIYTACKHMIPHNGQPYCSTIIQGYPRYNLSYRLVGVYLHLTADSVRGNTPSTYFTPAQLRLRHRVAFAGLDG